MGHTRPRVAWAVGEDSYRRPRDDELSVMRAFASHASHCPACEDPERTHREGRSLCPRGYNYAKDIGNYFYCLSGRPYSIIDRESLQQQQQVEVPKEYTVVRALFKALDKGFDPRPKRKATQPTVIHESNHPTYFESESSYTIIPESRRQRERYYEDGRRRKHSDRDAIPRSEHRGSLYEHDEARRHRKRHGEEVIIIPEGHRYRR